jgi:hypothetical protein
MPTMAHTNPVIPAPRKADRAFITTKTLDAAKRFPLQARGIAPAMTAAIARHYQPSTDHRESASCGAGSNLTEGLG